MDQELGDACREYEYALERVVASQSGLDDESLEKETILGLSRAEELLKRQRTRYWMKEFSFSQPIGKAGLALLVVTVLEIFFPALMGEWWWRALMLLALVLLVVLVAMRLRRWWFKIESIEFGKHAKYEKSANRQLARVRKVLKFSRVKPRSVSGSESVSVPSYVDEVDDV